MITSFCWKGSIQRLKSQESANMDLCFTTRMRKQNKEWWRESQKRWFDSRRICASDVIAWVLTTEPASLRTCDSCVVEFWLSTSMLIICGSAEARSFWTTWPLRGKIVSADRLPPSLVSKSVLLRFEFILPTLQLRWISLVLVGLWGGHGSSNLLPAAFSDVKYHGDNSPVTMVKSSA